MTVFPVDKFDAPISTRKKNISKYRNEKLCIMYKIICILQLVFHREFNLDGKSVSQ